MDLEAAGSVFNAGNIQGQYAIVARAGGTVTNDTGGNVTGGADGIVVGQSGYNPPVNGSGTTGTVINNGNVTALGNGTYANGVVLNVDGVLNQNAASVQNNGTIMGFQALAGGASTIGLGIALNYGGVVKNSGLIQGGRAGISAGGNTPQKGPATIGNTGSIVGGQYGVRLFAGGLLRNGAGATIQANYSRTGAVSS